MTSRLVIFTGEYFTDEYFLSSWAGSGTSGKFHEKEKTAVSDISFL